MSTIAEDIAAALASHPRMPSKANGGPVTFEGRGGAMTLEEIKRISRQSPAVLVAVTGTSDPQAVKRQFGGKLWTPMRVTIGIAATGPHVTMGSTLSRHEKVQIILLSILNILGKWQTVVTNPTETAPAYHIGNLEKPEGVTSRNLYDSGADASGIAIWEITYTANYEHADSLLTDFNDWDLLHSEHPKDEWREGVVVDPLDTNLTTEKDMSP